MNLISRIAPVTDAETASLARSGTLAALADDIAATALAADGRDFAAAGHGPQPRHPRRRRLLIGVPAAAGLAVLGLIVSAAVGPGQHVGPVNIGPVPAQAAVLSITRHGGYLDVIVRDPVADPRRYRAEFAKYHLDISLRLVPASPSIVGSVVYADYPAGKHGIEPITAVGKCYTGGGGDICPVGVRVPLTFHGAATLVFGRAAKPGERYASAGLATAPGEAMHGLNFVGKTAAQVLAMLARRGVTVPQWRVQRAGQCSIESRRTVPGNWYVSQAIPWAPGQVLLFASQARAVTFCQGVPRSPVPTPSP